MYLTVCITLGSLICECDAFRRVSRFFMLFYPIPPVLVNTAALLSDNFPTIPPPDGARTDSQGLSGF